MESRKAVADVLPSVANSNEEPIMSMESHFGERPEPNQPQEPGRAPEPTPWHDPGPPVRKVSLPPDQPGTGVPVDNPDTHTPDEPDQH